MPSGGRRNGAGRKPSGMVLPKSAAMRAVARERIVELVGSTADPLLFVCRLATDEKQPVDIRLSAASIALPYLHPRLSAMAVQTSKAPERPDQNAVLAELTSRLDRLAAPSPVIDVVPVKEPAT